MHPVEKRCLTPKKAHFSKVVSEGTTRFKLNRQLTGVIFAFRFSVFYDEQHWRLNKVLQISSVNSPLH